MWEFKKKLKTSFISDNKNMKNIAKTFLLLDIGLVKIYIT